MRPMFFALLIVGAFVNTGSAQNVKGNPQPRGVRVAVVNVGLILEKYELAREIKDDLKEVNRKKNDFEPIALGVEIQALEQIVRSNDVPAKARKDAEKRLEDARKRLREVESEQPRKLSKDSTDGIVDVWTDIQDAVAKYAAKHEIDLVFGYTDPLNKDELDLFPNVNRKMQAMDKGSTVPLAATTRVDISNAILDRLNARAGAVEDNKSAKVIAGTERVAVLNVGLVFNKFKKAMRFKNELEETVLPYKEEARKLQDKMRVWDQTIRDRDFADETEEQLRAKISKAKRRLEDMSSEVSRVLGKKQENNLVELWKDVRAGIKTYADRHHIDLVLGYGDPMQPDLLDQFANVNRKMQAMDLGDTVSYFHAPRADIAAGVVNLLNDPEEAKNDEAEAPAFRMSVVNVGHVFAKYDRSSQFKKELEEKRASFMKKAARLTNEGRKLELGELSAEMGRALGKRQEEILMTVWKEVHMGTAAYAKDPRVGFDIVFGFGDPTEKELLNQFSNVKRKLNALDLGSTVPLFAAPRVNVSEPVTQLVNRWLREAEKKNAFKVPEEGK